MVGNAGKCLKSWAKRGKKFYSWRVNELTSIRVITTLSHSSTRLLVYSFTSPLQSFYCVRLTVYFLEICFFIRLLFCNFALVLENFWGICGSRAQIRPIPKSGFHWKSISYKNPLSQVAILNLGRETIGIKVKTLIFSVIPASLHPLPFCIYRWVTSRYRGISVLYSRVPATAATGLAITTTIL